MNRASDYEATDKGRAAAARPATETGDKCAWAFHCDECGHLLMFCTCDKPAAPTLDDVKAALLADLRAAEERYKRLTLDVLQLPANVVAAKQQVRALRTTLATLNLYCDTWELLRPDSDAAPEVPNLAFHLST